uniref:Putative AHM1 n=1 Tax=Phyllostachys edulis TaxID=38705 RepID=D3IVG7_PHYED|nr:putative AHM1 [Phyllostachys edulis]
MAEKLLIAHDHEGCNQFVSQALVDDPRTPGPDDLVVAAADPANAILSLNSTIPASHDPNVIYSHYRRLCLLLNRSHPDRPCSLAFADAARLVVDSWTFLYDPLRKASHDAAASTASLATCSPATAGSFCDAAVKARATNRRRSGSRRRMCRMRQRFGWPARPAATCIKRLNRAVHRVLSNATIQHKRGIFSQMEPSHL